MRKHSSLIIVLCTCATFFCTQDTKAAKSGRRTTESWLTNAAEWVVCRQNPPAFEKVVRTADCSAPDDDPMASCPEIVEYAEALDVVRTMPHCIDEAIDALNNRFLRVHPDAASNLAAAYIIRAQREDDPVDFLHGADAADLAIITTPELPAAWFNRALALEAVGLNGEAVASWNHVMTLDTSRWADEARVRRDRLTMREKNRDEAVWNRSRNALMLALRAGDRNVVARLIAPFPAAAQRYFEEELLPQWANAPTKEQLDRLKLFAAALSTRLGGDPFPIDTVNAIERAQRSPEQLAALRNGHAGFLAGRTAELAVDRKKAAQHFEQAAILLQRGLSPFQFRAELGHVGTGGDPQELATIAAALPHDYRYLRARVHWLQGYFLQNADYFESLTHYDAARAEYTKLRDYESLTAIHSRLGGVLVQLGHRQLAWREVSYALQHASHLFLSKDRDALSTEVVTTALELEHPAIALRHQNLALLRNLRQTSPNLLAIALRKHAETALGSQDVTRAAADLAEAERIAATADSGVRRVLQARSDEIRGRQFLERDPQNAWQAFTHALDATDPDQRTALTSILTQRAEASLLLQHPEDAEQDLRHALAVLEEEQTQILAKRTIGERENLWAAYFGRFQRTSHLLIQLLMDQNRPIEAFDYVERTRAVEPLDLITRRRVHTQHPMKADDRIAQIRKNLSAGTFLIEYAVLPERTYVWIFSRDSFRSRELNVTPEDILRWNTTLRRAIKKTRENPYQAAAEVNGVMSAAYGNLAADVMSEIRSMPGGQMPARLVFVPDGGIHGLPIHAFHTPQPDKYLSDVAPIETSGSAALYLEALARDRALPQPQQLSVLSIGDPAFDPDFPLARYMRRLKYARKEARDICDSYSRCEPLIDQDATIPAFLARARDVDVIHVAAHAIVNPRTPSRSMILLARSGIDSGVLDAEKLLTRLKLDRTRLVVLATCSSAGGLPVGPEGVAPFVRSILATGVPAVIGSLWDVQDATTESFMVSFHRHYEESRDAALAMQEAKRDLLMNNNNRPDPKSVLAWAPFQVIGHTAPPPGTRRPFNGVNHNGVPASHSLQRSDRLRPQ